MTALDAHMSEDLLIESIYEAVLNSDVADNAIIHLNWGV